MVSGDLAELAAYQTIVAAFEKGHPEVDVTLIHIPSDGDYRARLAADFTTGQPPDVFLLNYRRYASFAARGVLEPVGDYLAHSTLIHESDFYAEALDPFRWKGALTCLPQNISSLAVYYNADLFAAAGWPLPSAEWTRDDFLQAALALTLDTDGDGVTDQYGVGVEPTLIRVAPFIWQGRGELVAPTVAPRRLALNTAEALRAVQWFVDLQTAHHVAPDAVAEASEDSETRFMNGRLGMYLDSRRAVPSFRAAITFEWDVAPLPQDKGRRANVLHADAYCLSAVAADKNAAWQFIEYANSVEGQTVMAGTGRTVPSLKAVAESEAFLNPAARPANSRVWVDAIPTLRAVPVLPNWVDIENAASEELERAFYGQATVEEAVGAAILRTDEYFQP